MKTQSSAKPFGFVKQSAALLAAMLFGALTAVPVFATELAINVVGVGANGQPLASPITSYRWTVEQDATKPSVPGQTATRANSSLSFHTSYMPVVAAGRVGPARDDLTPRLADPDYQRLHAQALPQVCAGAVASNCLDPAKRYFVSIATEGFQMGGAPVVFSGTGTGTTATATVYLNQYELPTAQISIFAFNDNNPLNGTPDLPQEVGLAGFTVQLFEAGGTFGQSGGAVTQDGFGNPLGTRYDANGDPIPGSTTGIILTGEDGVVTIKNLYPAKYTVVIVPPVGSDWTQTSTIEGTKGVDVWVKNSEPAFFQEVGPPGHHVFTGFTKSGKLAGNTAQGNPCVIGTAGCTPVLNPSINRTISGRVVNTHHSRPPAYTFYKRSPVAECWVGLNEPAKGRALYAAPCNKDSTFSIPNVPSGTYELAIFDEPLDTIFGTTTITVGASSVNLGDFPVSSWFARYQGRVFQDIDGTGLPFFHKAFDKPHIEIDPVTGVEREVVKSYAAGDLKPPFGSGIASNIRFRDGSIYQATATKSDGTFAFTEVFPFFNWLVAEIDYARFKATSATVVVDEGGCIKVLPTDCADAPNANEGTNAQKLWNAVPGLFGSNDPALAYNPWIRLNPQLQETCTAAQVAANTDSSGNIIDYTACFQVGDKYYRTEQGVILLEAMQAFLGQTHHVEWGKQPYSIDENGGIAGIVQYAITRAEDDPRFAAAEEWEPGIPRVQVNMFIDCDGDGKPDKPLNNGTGLCAPGGLSGADGYVYDKPDVDNYPFCWRAADESGSEICPDGTQKGPEDVKRSTTGGANTFSFGDVFSWGGPGNGPGGQLHVGLGKTDAWDDSIPEGCVDKTPYAVPFSNPPDELDCFDGLRNYGQVRPSVFDGGYAFGSVAGQAHLPMLIGPTGDGKYILEAVAPPGYLHQGVGDQNVAFGDVLRASPAALPFECVGMELPVPQYLTLFRPDGQPEPNPSYGSPQFPNNTWRKCDMKAVSLVPGTNPAPNFFLFTEAPVAGHGVGFILDDTASEFNTYAPNFGEKYAPPHLPVSVQDWTGREITRVYSDQFGSYNFLVPSSFTINPPFPSGVMPSMMVACMNHPGPVKIGTNPDGTDKMGVDPYFNRRYSQFCYTFQYLAGKTTYLDTPVLPVAAFAQVEKNPLDCECADGTPTIYSVNNGTDNGPWVPASGNRTLSIVSVGTTPVVNPFFDPEVQGSARTINRDYGFGNVAGSVTIGGVPLTAVSWADGLITGNVPGTVAAGQYQLMIQRGDNGKESVVGLTVHVGGPTPKKVNPAGSNGAFRSIQAAIDSPSTQPGDLITVAPGVYKEYVIMDKRVRLQGWGAGSTLIDAAKSAATGLSGWRELINAKLDPTGPVGAQVPGPNRTFDLLPGQKMTFEPASNEPGLFGADEGPGILVVGKGNTGLLAAVDPCVGGNANPLQIDGLTITGADLGGGILASGYACKVEVSNNRLTGNYGTYGGGVRIGHTALVVEVDQPNGTQVISYIDGVNRQPNIHHNWVAQNGATAQGGGGGITLGAGSNSYSVTRNYVCGNFSMADGGGISHLGRSDGLVTPLINTFGNANRISNNTVIFNQTFNQAADPMGGGISIASHIPQGGANYEGSGDVVVDGNLIQGNQAGAGSGGGVSIVGARSVSLGGFNFNIFTDNIWLINNMITNNVAAYTGGGVSLTGIGTGVKLVNNTVASNISSATNRQAFGTNSPAEGSQSQVAGISVLEGNSPTMLNNIVWGNRSYIFLIDGTTVGLFNPGTTSVAAPNPDPSYRDLGRVSGSGTPSASNSLFTTGATGFTGSNNIFQPATSTTVFITPTQFASLVDPTHPVILPETTVSLHSALTFDETGNFVNVIFQPLTQWNADGSQRADYHIKVGSPAINAGANRTSGATGNQVPVNDFDLQARTTTNVDIGADEYVAPALPPTLTSITPATGGQGQNVAVTLAGTNLANASAVTMSGVDVTCVVGSSTATSVSANCAIGATAAIGTRTVTVTTPGGTSGTVNFSVTAALPAIHVGDIDATKTVSGFLNSQWNAFVTVTVHNGSHGPVQGVVVSGAWTFANGFGTGSGSGTCTTNAAGQCTLSRTGMIRATRPEATYTVNSLTLAGQVYQAGSNHDPDGDSNGTAITVTRP